MSVFLQNERYDSLVRLYGAENFLKLRNSRILVVGAGGIGCEILKNLAYIGVDHVELVDLDTIDVSNLNRQFLFRPEHVGKPKALVAGDMASKFNNDMHVFPHYDNIKSSTFSIEFIATFSIVLNALDNVDARRHVNRLCLAAQVPLIDSGTTGYLGQVTPIVKGVSSCYECYPKPTQKVYPICTIRSTPDKPVHCIVWAKECFKLLFGSPSESMLFEDEASSGETSTYMGLIAFPSESAREEEILAYGKALLNALYGAEIEKRLSMGVYKTAKQTPVGLDSAVVEHVVGDIGLHAAEADPCLSEGWEQKIFTVQELVLTFLRCLQELSASPKDRALLGSLSFDKDDLWAMKFVFAAANLRMHVFSILPIVSFHNCKGIAGNIVPAISTTNAIVAGIQVSQAIKIITSPNAELYRGGGGGNIEQAKLSLCHTYCLRLPTRRGYYLQPLEAEKSMPSCYVCNKSQISLQIDTETSTLEDVVKKVIKGKLGFNEPIVMLGSSFLYEEGEGADEDLRDNLPLPLAQCPAGGVRDGTLLTLEDFTQKLNVQILIKHIPSSVFAETGSEGVAADQFIVDGQDAFHLKQVADAASQKKEDLTSSNASNSNGDSSSGVTMLDDDVVELVESQNTSAAAESTSVTTTSNGNKKRKREESKEEEEIL